MADFVRIVLVVRILHAQAVVGKCRAPRRW